MYTNVGENFTKFEHLGHFRKTYNLQLNLFVFVLLNHGCAAQSYKIIKRQYVTLIFFIYEATPSYLKCYLMQVTSIVLKLQLL